MEGLKRTENFKEEICDVLFDDERGCMSILFLKGSCNKDMRRKLCLILGRWQE